MEYQVIMKALKVIGDAAIVGYAVHKGYYGFAAAWFTSSICIRLVF